MSLNTKEINSDNEMNRWVELANSSKDPVLIHSKENSAVLISEKVWESIQETLFLMSIPEMRESIIEGMKTPIEDCSDNLDW